MLTLAEAAEQLGIHPDTLRMQIHRGKLKARKVGPLWTITERELERYRKGHRRAGPVGLGLTELVGRHDKRGQ